MFAYAAVAILFLVVLIPPFVGSVQISKSLLVICGSGVLLILAGIQIILLKTIHWSPVVVIAGVAALFVGVSTVLSSAPLASLVGTAFEQGSGFYLLSLCALLYATAVLFSLRSGLPILIGEGLIAATGAASAASLLEWIFIGKWAPGGFSLVGSLQGLEILAGSAVLSYIAFRQFFHKPLLPYLCTAAGLSLLFLIFFGSPRTALIVLALSAFAAYVRFSNGTRDLREWAVHIFVGIGLCFVILGNFSYSEFAVYRLNPSASIAITSATLTQNIPHALFGAGPGRFSVAWHAWRPVAANRTPFWNEELHAAYSTALTRIVEWGLIPPFFALVGLALLALRTITILNSEQGTRIIPTLVLFSYFSALFLLSTIDAAVEWVAVFFAGLLLVQIFPSRPIRHGVFAQGIVASVCGLVFVASSLCAAAAYSSHEQALETFSLGEYTKSTLSLDLQPSLFFSFPSSLLSRSLAEMQLRALEQELDSGDAGRLISLADAAASNARRAARLDPSSFEAQITLGNVYARRFVLGDKESFREAWSAYSGAQRLSPHHPLPLYLLAQINMLAGNKEEARIAIEGALTRKFDYEDAQQLFEVLQK